MLENRILEVFKYSQLSRIEFAEKMDISNAVLSHLASGRNKAGTELIINILKNYPEISAEWLLLGEGDMIKKDNKAALASAIDKSLAELQDIQQIQTKLNDKINKISLELTKLK